jgi:hypothetical protein
MKVWPIDPLVPRNLRLEVPEKLPQGLEGLKYGFYCPKSEVQPSDLVGLPATHLDAGTSCKAYGTKHRGGTPLFLAEGIVRIRRIEIIRS